MDAGYFGFEGTPLMVLGELRGAIGRVVIACEL